jgi:hypothetical protein
MLGYSALRSCACIWHGASQVKVREKIREATAVNFGFICPLPERPCPILVIVPNGKIRTATFDWEDQRKISAGASSIRRGGCC